jgi:hypothetical protein
MPVLVSLSFKREVDDTLVTFTNTVHHKMSTDTQYASLKTFVEGIRLKNDAFILSIANASQGGKDRNDIRKDCRFELEKLLVFVARQLEYLAEGNPRFITDSGYELRNTKKTPKTTTPITTLDAPILKVHNSEKTRCADLTWDDVKNVLYYGIRYKLRTETVWITDDFNDIGEFSFTNLEANNVYDFAVRAMGAGGVVSEWSTPVPVFIT